MGIYCNHQHYGFNGIQWEYHGTTSHNYMGVSENGNTHKMCVFFNREYDHKPPKFGCCSLKYSDKPRGKQPNIWTDPRVSHRSLCKSPRFKVEVEVIGVAYPTTMGHYGFLMSFGWCLSGYSSQSIPIHRFIRFPRKLAINAS
jgi:hypothetical protein